MVRTDTKEVTHTLSLTCREARMLMRTIPHLKESKFTNEQSAAVRHYLHCDKCIKLGVLKITGAETCCKDAILRWISRDMHSSPSGGEGAPSTFPELLAIEHVWGHANTAEDETRSRWHEGTLHERVDACPEFACAYIRSGLLPSNYGGFDEYGSSYYVQYHMRALRLFAGCHNHEWSVADLVQGQCALIGKGRAARALQATIIAAAEFAGTGKDLSVLTKVFAPQFKFLHQAIMLETCEHAGSVGCDWYASDRDCGTNCSFTASFVGNAQTFICECLVGKPLWLELPEPWPRVARAH